MRELAVELKQLRMHGMAGAWVDLVEHGGGGGGGAALDSSRWLLEHLLQAETTDRAMRSVSHLRISANVTGDFGERDRFERSVLSCVGWIVGRGRLRVVGELRG